MLSACSSAGEKLDADQGLNGLASAFLFAGVSQVVATLWPISDEAAAQAMGSFYKSYSSGDSPMSALQKARKALRNSPSTSDPFFWASFVLFGAGAP